MPPPLSRRTSSVYFEVLWDCDGKEADVIIVQTKERSISLTADPLLPKTFVNSDEPLELLSDESATLRTQVNLIAYRADKYLAENFTRYLNIQVSEVSENVLARATFMQRPMEYVWLSIKPADMITNVRNAMACGSYESLATVIEGAKENMFQTGVVEQAKQQLQRLEVKAEQVAAVQAMRDAKLSGDVAALLQAINRAEEVNADSFDIAKAKNDLHIFMEVQSVRQDLNSAAQRCHARELRRSIDHAKNMDALIEGLDSFEATLLGIEEVERRIEVTTNARHIDGLGQALERAQNLRIDNEAVRDARMRLHFWRAEEAKKKHKWEAYFQYDSSSEETEILEAIDIEAVKTAVFMKECSGFCILRGSAYIKKIKSPPDFKGCESEHMLYHAVVKDLPSSQHRCQTRTGLGCAMVERQGGLGCTLIWQYSDESCCGLVWREFPYAISSGLEQAYRNDAISMRFVFQAATYVLLFEDMELYLADNGKYSKRSDARRHFVAPRELEVMWHPFLKANCLVEHCNRRNNPVSLSSDICTSVQTLSNHYVEQLKSARGERRIELPLPTWRHIDVDAVIVLAAVSVACFTVCPRGPGRACFLFQCEDDKLLWDDALHDAKIRMRKLAEMPNESIVPDQCGFSWLRHNNDARSRFLRLAGACSSLYHCMTGVDNRGNSIARHIETLVQNTELLDYEKIVSEGLPYERFQTTLVEFERGQTLLQVAVMYANRGCRVTVASAASGYHVGGGFLSGGRHALEEAICMQSTLYFSLAQAVEISRSKHIRDSNYRHIHIPEEGCVLSPNVEILRHGSDRGYSLQENVVTLVAVLSVAMPNKNPNVTDSPVDRRDTWAYSRLLERKFETVVRGAIKSFADVLIMPDCGCGVFKNDPVVVGKALGKVLRNKKGYFSKVVLVGSDSFAKAVREEFDANYLFFAGYF